MKRNLEQRIIAKISRRLLPLIVGIYFVAYIDRTNVGFAALQMNKSLGFSEYVYGWGAGIFFLGYFFFEVCVFRSKSARHSEVMSAADSGLMSAIPN